MNTSWISPEDIAPAVEEVVADTTVWDYHTHLFPASFGSAFGRGVDHDPKGLMLWGIDDLLTYHYLVAELFRALGPGVLAPEKFWSFTKEEQGDLIWRTLFREATPVSEACRGVLTTLQRLGLDPNEPTLAGYRKWFADQEPDAHTDHVMELAGVGRITMTNDPFDDNERPRWLAEGGEQLGKDPRFPAVLRLDPMIIDWPGAAAKLNEWGYAVTDDFNAKTIEEGRRFLRDWITRLNAAYCAVSLPPRFRFPADPSDPVEAAGEKSLRELILPVCTELGLPFAMMIGVNRGANPAIRMAGDIVAKADVESVANLCREFPDQKFMCTMLARENQHELFCNARKFSNLMPFGCWWFLNVPSLIEEMTRMRVELLGLSHIPQHSDARVLEQLLYKWDHSRRVIAKVMVEKYADVAATGFRVTRQAIQSDVHALLWGHTENWLAER